MRPWWARQGAASDVIRPAQPAMHAFPAVLQGGELMSALGRWVLQLRWGGGFWIPLRWFSEMVVGSLGKRRVGSMMAMYYVCMHVCIDLQRRCNWGGYL